MSQGLSFEWDAILTRFDVGRLSSAPVNREASYTGRIQNSEVSKGRVSSSVRDMTEW